MEKQEKFRLLFTKEDKMILQTNKICKKFSGFYALKDVSFEVKENDKIGIIGANGSGKTTLVEIIAGVSKPSSGKIKYGFKFNSSPKEFIGMQFQNSNYPSGLTTKDIVSFAINIRKLKNAREETLQKLLQIFGMENIYHKKVSLLSGGERQKLNILISVIHKPKLLILDEISTGLDISSRDEIIKFTKKIVQTNKMTLILISHQMEEIKQLCKKVIFIKEGVIQEIDTVKKIEQKYGSLELCAKQFVNNVKRNDESNF